VDGQEGLSICYFLIVEVVSGFTPVLSPLLNTYSRPKDNTTQALAISRVIANSDSAKHLIFPSW